MIFDLDAPRVDTEATRAALDARSADDTMLLRDQQRARFTVRLPADAPDDRAAADREPRPAPPVLFDPQSGASL